MLDFNTPVQVTIENRFQTEEMVIKTIAGNLIDIFDQCEVLEVMDLETGELYYYIDLNLPYYCDPTAYMAESLKTFLGTL